MKDLFKVTDAASRRAALKLLAYGLWIRLAFIAALAVAGALVALVDGYAGVAIPLAVIVLGAALTAFAWYRADATMRTLEAPTGSAPAAPRAFAAGRIAPAPAPAQA